MSATSRSLLKHKGSLVSATSRSLLKLDQALNRGGWAGTLNTLKAHAHRHRSVRSSERNGCAVGQENPKRRRTKQAKLDRAATAHAWAAYEPHSRVPIRLSAFPLGIPSPPKRRTDPFSVFPRFWFHDGYRPCDPHLRACVLSVVLIHTFTLSSQPRNFGRPRQEHRYCTVLDRRGARAPLRCVCNCAPLKLVGT